MNVRIYNPKIFWKYMQERTKQTKKIQTLTDKNGNTKSANTLEIEIVKRQTC